MVGEGDVLPLVSVVSAIAVPPTARSAAHTIKRSVNLLLSLVRISSCPFLGVGPTHLVPCVHSYLSLPLHLGSEFHNFRRLLPCSKYRLSSGGGRALC